MELNSDGGWSAVLEAGGPVPDWPLMPEQIEILCCLPPPWDEIDEDLEPPTDPETGND